MDKIIMFNKSYFLHNKRTHLCICEYAIPLKTMVLLNKADKLLTSEKYEIIILKNDKSTNQILRKREE